MSKYIKLEDAVDCVANDLEERANMVGFKPQDTNYFKDKACGILQDLPTIEVSEDCISRDWILEEFSKGRENISKSEYFDELVWLVIHAPSVVPRIPSEDCISREYLKSFEYINKGDFNSVETIREWIDNAPSVVPTQTNANQCVESVERAEGECNICRFAGCSECDNCINGSQWVRATKEDEE